MIDKNIKYEDLERLNGNIIKLPVHDEWWKIKEKLEEETNGDDETKIIDNGKVASAPHPDESWFGLWDDLDGKGIVPKSIRTLTEFKKWFYQQDLDVEMFSRGGIASLMKRKII